MICLEIVNILQQFRINIRIENASIDLAKSVEFLAIRLKKPVMRVKNEKYFLNFFGGFSKLLNHALQALASSVTPDSR